MWLVRDRRPVQYKKVFSNSRFTTKSRCNFRFDSKLKSIFVGSRIAESKNIYIGKVIEKGVTSSLLDYNIFCDISFPHVIGVFGSRGSGKSFDLGVFLEGILSCQQQHLSDAAIVFDVQDQFWTLAHQPRESIDLDRSQIDDLSLWGLNPYCVNENNIFIPEISNSEIPNSTTFTLAAEQLSPSDWLAILELEQYSAMGQVLITLLEDNKNANPDQLSSVCVNKHKLKNFQQNSIDGVRWRLESLAKAKIISSVGISIDELLKPGVLSVFLMRNLSESIRGLVVGVIARLVSVRLGQIQQARKVALRTNKKNLNEFPNLTKRLWMVIDEAHVLVPSDGTTVATAPLIDYVKRGRDSGLSLIYATQQPASVNSKLMSQVDLTITHTLGFDTDINAAIARMPTRSSVDYEINNQKVNSLNDVIRSLNPGEAILADSTSGRVFIAKIRPRLSAHGGTNPE